MRTVKKRSQKQEDSVAKTFGGRVTAASGALWGMKGDVRNDKFLIECKTTEKDYYTLTAKVWEKIQEEAIKDHMRTPLMIIDLKDKDRYVVFRPKDFVTQIVTPILPSGILKEKAFKITKKLLGYNEFNDYVSAYHFILGGRQNNVLCVMLYKDFENIYKEELKC